MPRPTLSADGEKRFTLRTEARVGRDALECFVSHWITRNRDPDKFGGCSVRLHDPQQQTSRKAILDAVRDEIRETGWLGCLSKWNPECCDDREEHIKRAAKALVRRRFPDLEGE